MVKKKKTAETSKTIATNVVNMLKKEFGDTSAFFLDDSENNTVLDVTDWVPTGSSLLDLVISNRPYGGVPAGKIIEIYGLESTGKSMLGAHILRETQKKGGIGVYIDNEHSSDSRFLQAIGVDIKNLIVGQTNTIEECFEFLETMVNIVREKDNNTLVTIVVDSIAGMPTKDELSGSFSVEGYGGSPKAKFLGLAMRRITGMISKQRICCVFINQLRDKLGCIHPETTEVVFRKLIKYL